MRFFRRRIPMCMFCRKNAYMCLSGTWAICKEHTNMLGQIARPEYKIWFSIRK